MRPAAHVEPVGTRPVDRQLLAFRKFGRPFGLEALALRGPAVDQGLAAPGLAAQRLVGADDLAHLLLDRRQVVHRERFAARGRQHVVIEAVIGRRAESDLRARPQRLHRLGEDVGIVVPGEFERLGLVARGHQRQRRVARKRPRQVHQLAPMAVIDPRRQRRLGEAGADRGGDIGGGRPRWHLAHGTIGQADLEQFGHGVLALRPRAP